MGEFQETLKTLFLYGIVTGFIPVVCVGLLIWTIQGTIKGLYGLLTAPRYEHVNPIPRVKSEDEAVSRAKYFEKAGK